MATRLGDRAPAPYNPRKISAAQLGALGRAMEAFGDLSGIVHNRRTGHLVGGHQRVKHIPPDAEIVLTEQAAEPNAQGTVATGHVLFGGERWTYREVDVDEQTEKAMNLAANKHGGEWDLEPMSAILADLAMRGYDMELTGFAPGELGEILGQQPDAAAPDPGAQIDRAEELREKWGTERGQIWGIPSKTSPGKTHRLMCGDSTSAEDVGRLLGDARPRLMVTDPPYGVEYDANWRNEADRANGKPYGARAVGLVSNDDEADWTEAWRLSPAFVVYCWHAGRHASTVQRSLEDAGFEMRSQIVWAKTRLIISRGHYHWQHEPCWYAFRKGETAGWIGDRSQTTLWTIEHAKSESGHSTEKPLECMQRPIRNHEGDVHEPFGGSGTTFVAAENERRVCYGMEIGPAYVAVALERLTGMGLAPFRITRDEEA